MECGVHGQREAGIHGDSLRGAFSICISGGYEDNRDFGDTMYVTLCPSGTMSSSPLIAYMSAQEDETEIAMYICRALWTSVAPLMSSQTQTADQSFANPRNSSLYVSSLTNCILMHFTFIQRSKETKLPVRVVRGPDKHNPWAPNEG